MTRLPSAPRLLDHCIRWEAPDMGERTRRQVGVSEAACGVCGTSPLLVMESRRKRRGLALLDPRWRPHRRTYELCTTCGCRYPWQDGRRL